ncbi:HAD family hydrolase [Streptomyces iconiensis]|uniref:HAD-IA family hydrolase n=1 Tax=Streptomyces iconiensis TaxID=1384038 RepID=A0ABT7A7S9_9ACTN|nr:HAD-IA family hydrolase [Streptomyces iconiensis]MDJ1137127.1 HAD-IA family hydrolase [Streptomyces iconiensis]
MPSHQAQRALASVRAVVFDTDGVLLDSAHLHEAAWKAAFDPLLEGRGDLPDEARRPFSEEDYRRCVDGKSRLDGAAAFLSSRGVALPQGSPDDPPGEDSVRAVAARKDGLFSERLRTGSVEVWPGTLWLLRVLEGAGVPCAAVSASRHARELLGRAGLMGLLRTLVDGQEAARLGLAGKPSPDLFLEAASRLGTPPGGTAVVEDALAGVEAGRRGGFAQVIGVDRTQDPANAADLRAYGADLVVNDLSELLDPAQRAAWEAAQQQDAARRKTARDEEAREGDT